MRDRRFLLFGVGPGEYSWRGVWLLLWVFGGSLLAAGLLAPPVYFAVQQVAAGAEGGLWAYLAGQPFPRYVDRLRWLPVLLALPWLIKACGLASPRALGLTLPFPWRGFVAGFLGGALMLAVLAGIQIGAGVVEARPDALARLAGKVLPGALLSGVVIALLEETVFRGLVLRQFYTALRPWPAILITSLFFALLHFKKIPHSIWGADDPVGWGSGLYIAFWTLLSVVATFDLVFFFNYFLVGVVLALLVLRTGNLWAAIGLHAGWVFFLKVYAPLFATTAPGHLLFGGTRVIDGVASLALLALLAVLLARRPRPGGRDDPATPGPGLA